MDLRAEMDAELRGYGHNILYQRCTNSGAYSQEYERHTTRHRYPASVGLPSAEQSQMEGLTHSVDMIYYFRWDVNPRERDRIYEDDIRYTTYVMYTIDYAVPMRGVGGRIEYWVAGASRQEPN